MKNFNKIKLKIPPDKKNMLIMVTSSIIAFILILTTGLIFVAPVVKAQIAFNQSVNLEELQKQVQILKSQPDPKTMDTSEIEKSLKMLPSDADSTRFLMMLSELANQSKITIMGLTLENDKQEQSPFSVDSNAKSTSNSELQNGGGRSKEADDATPVTTDSQIQLISSNHYRMDISGTYPQLRQFINSIQNAERIIRINDWSLNTVAGKNNAETPVNAASANTGSAAISASLNLELYYVPKFAEQFPSNSPYQVGAPANKTDPTIW